MHLAVALENSTLRRTLNFFSSRFQVSPWLGVSPDLWIAIRLFADEGTCRNMRRQVHRCRFRFCPTSFFSFLLLHPFRHRVGGSLSSWIFFGAAKTAEMADVEQMMKIIPFVTCEITCGQNVCELMFGINVSNLNFRIKINPVKQPIQSNSVGS